MLIKFKRQHEQYKVGAIVDVEIDFARRLLELGFASFVPTLQSLSDVKSYDDYEDKALHQAGEIKNVTKRTPAAPRRRSSVQTKK